ncbi:MAG: DUF5709 domain-containing protein [Angustibacter sp.]
MTGPDREVDSSGVFSVDDEDQPGAEDVLDDRGLTDPLDEGYSPPERPRGVEAFGTTFEEARRGETMDQRLAQEEPDLVAGDPSGELLTDDPDENPDVALGIDPADDWSGGEVGYERAGRLVDPDEGVRSDTEDALVGEDVGIDGAAASAEEAAMHVVDERS